MTLRTIYLSTISLLLLLSSSLAAQNKWSGEAEQWTKGDGSAANPYLIEKPEHLAYLSRSMQNTKESYNGIYFRQTTDLDMNASGLSEEQKNFHPIGLFDAGQAANEEGKMIPFDESIPFNGIYEGGNHQISDLYIFYDNVPDPYAPDEVKGKKILTIGGAGLFGFIGPKGVVRNLTLAPNCTLRGGQEIGSIASYSMGLIYNCHSMAKVFAQSPIAGGMVGTMLGGSLVHSSFCGEVRGTMNIGGLVGALSLPKDINLTGYEVTPHNVSECFVHATITTTGFYAGAAIGYVGQVITMKQCYFSAEIKQEEGVEPLFTGRFIGCFEREEDFKKSSFSSVYVDTTPPIVGGEMLVGDRNDKTIPGVTLKTSEEMKQESFAKELGNAFVFDAKNENGGFPMLSAVEVTPLANNEITQGEELRIYPNPVKDQLYISDCVDEIAIYTLEGSLVTRTTASQVIDTHRIPNGEYLIVLNGSDVHKIHIQH